MNKHIARINQIKVNRYGTLNQLYENLISIVSITFAMHAYIVLYSWLIWVFLFFIGARFQTNLHTVLRQEETDVLWENLLQPATCVKAIVLGIKPTTKHSFAKVIHY